MNNYKGIFKTSIFFFIMLLSTDAILAQIEVQGYAFESGNRGYLNQVSVKLLDMSGREVSSGLSDRDGKFVLAAPSVGSYVVKGNKELFHETEMNISVKEAATFVKLELKRAPGYIFEITLADKKHSPDDVVDQIKGALIEVYNNTTRQEVMVLKDYAHPEFKINLAKGNHYTILVRKNGYLSKQMEAFVDVEGCILCLEGFGTVEPGVSDNLTEGNEMGTLLANVEMDSVFRGKKIELENIYFDLAKWNIRDDAAEELEKVAYFLRTNPRLSVELGSHTDVRGSSASNLKLSQKRAKSTTNWLTNRGKIREHRITWKGYGDTQIINHCVEGVECSDSDHEQNRRTELKVTGYSKSNYFKPLSDIKKEEHEEELILELQNQTSIKVTGDITSEEELNKVLNSAAEQQATEIVVETETAVEEIPVVEEVIEQEVETMIEKPSTAIVEQQEIIEENVELVTSTESDTGLRTGLMKGVTSERVEGFNGYSFVIQESHGEISSDNKILSTHASNLMKYVQEDGIVKYLVGSFDNYADAESFFTGTIKVMYPKAKMVRFENSKLVD